MILLSFSPCCWNRTFLTGSDTGNAFDSTVLNFIRFYIIINVIIIISSSSSIIMAGYLFDPNNAIILYCLLIDQSI